MIYFQPLENQHDALSVRLKIFIHCTVIKTLAYNFYKYLILLVSFIGPTFSHIVCVNITWNQTIFNHKHYKSGQVNDAQYFFNPLE